MTSDAYHELDSQWRSVRNLSFDEGGTQLRSKGGKCIVESQGLVNVPFWGYWTSPLNGNYRWDTSWLDNDPCWIMLNSQGVLVHVNLVTNTRLIPWMVWKTWRGDFFRKKKVFFLWGRTLYVWPSNHGLPVGFPSNQSIFCVLLDGEIMSFFHSNPLSDHWWSPNCHWSPKSAVKHDNR